MSPTTAQKTKNAARTQAMSLAASNPDPPSLWADPDAGLRGGGPGRRSAWWRGGSADMLTRCSFGSLGDAAHGASPRPGGMLRAGSEVDAPALGGEVDAPAWGGPAGVGDPAGLDEAAGSDVTADVGDAGAGDLPGADDTAAGVDAAPVAPRDGSARWAGAPAGPLGNALACRASTFGRWDSLRTGSGSERHIRARSSR